MNRLPEDLLRIIYDFDGRYKYAMDYCFFIIDCKRNPRKNYDRSILKSPDDITPYRLVRMSYHNDYVQFGFKRTEVDIKNGIEILNKTWVENNKELVFKYMSI